MNTYEKKYKEALERAKQLLRTSVAYDRFTIERIFPELKESEDEKIRKKLISLVKNWDKGGIVSKYTSDANEIKLILAWLEKQGEFYTKKDVDDAYLKGISDTKNELKKQGEQKPADSHCLDCTNVKGCVNCTDGDMKETGKPRWSEDDKKHIIDIIDYLDDYYSFAKDEYKDVADGVLNEIRWLQRI